MKLNMIFSVEWTTLKQLKKNFKKIRLDQESIRSKFEFSFVAPIHSYKNSGEKLMKISSKFSLSHHDHSVLQSIDITRRKLMLLTLRTQRFKGVCSATKRLYLVVPLKICPFWRHFDDPLRTYIRFCASARKDWLLIVGIPVSQRLHGNVCVLVPGSLPGSLIRLVH